MERLGKPGSGSFLSGLVDASRTGIVGYSMGGYGVVNVDRRRLQQGERDDRPARRRTSCSRSAAPRIPSTAKTIDPRIKAAIAIAPWGMQSAASGTPRD